MNCMSTIYKACIKLYTNRNNLTPATEVTDGAGFLGAFCDLCGFHLMNEIMSTVPITKRGAALLKEELQRLKTKDRPAVINAISEARAQGDLSENAEYDAAKERQSFIEGRIADLEGKLGAAQIIDPALLDADGRIVFASTVYLEDLESGEKVNYQIVGVDEADLKEKKVSITSPIARALIGKFAGDVVEVQAPSGIREYEVLEVRYI
jgi:transcription elongation factor GreA